MSTRQVLFRDEIHGDMAFSPLMTSIIDHRFFQRLRHIKQLGLAEHIFPCATHTRFQHSLGACFLSSKYFDSLFENYKNAPTHEEIINPNILQTIQKIQEDEKQYTFWKNVVAIAALLHDVGLRFFPKGILDRPRHLWSAEDTALYEQHPLKAAEILRDVRDLHSDILQMIVEHHENSAGTGFPKKIRDVKISHLGKVLGLANCFANLLHNPHPESKKYSPDEAINYIENIMGQPFNKQIFSALKNVINKKHLQDKT
jgi:response regulator RpfG family c-di-GMP phosphodiesterase